MGTFVNFIGDMSVPEEKRALFNRYMQKILDIGGIMDLSRVELDFDEIYLLEPVDLSEGKRRQFCFNYFEDCIQETADYDPAACRLETGKIGRGEFGRVMLAAYTLYQRMLPNSDDLEVNGEKVESDFSVGWLNHILGTGYTKFGSSEPMPPVTTCAFLKRDGAMEFSNNPPELAFWPRRYLTDDERLYWWSEKSDEVTLSDGMEAWLKEMAAKHRIISEDIRYRRNPAKAPDLKIVLVKIDEYYEHVYAFHSMYDEFMENRRKADYRAAVILLYQLQKDEANRASGRIIKQRGMFWDLGNQDLIRNDGRMTVKRFLAVMANRELRMRYFKF